MAATISFHSDQVTGGIQNLSGSGLGFFGASFGSSVEVGQYQSSTYITDGNGSTEGPNLNNIKWTHASSGQVNANDSWALQNIPNRYATLNIRFTNDDSVNVQNAAVRIYDRSNIANPASGVTTKVAELIHPDDNQATTGSGDSTWNTPGGATDVDLIDSPGLSGVNAMGGPSSTRHDWYLAISASPDSIGAKTLYGLYVELEYL